MSGKFTCRPLDLGEGSPAFIELGLDGPQNRCDSECNRVFVNVWKRI
jgi:hypothetical protein